ncbi:MAG: phosphocholine cytidylyltransferase family protein [Bryobacterales bacterium]|nr:phosphocholine cytidylyltransferase family protein [Bryobacterales bacterium]
MKAVILAAGRGLRIQPVTLGMPKCLLEFGDKTILDYQVEALWAAGISQIGIVIGHGGKRIVKHIARRFVDDPDCFQFIVNPVYSQTNNIYSLWLARDWVGVDDFLCLNADVLCHPAVLPPAVAAERPVSMIVDPEWREETMKVIIRDEDVVRMSKLISRDEYSATYIGITAFSRLTVPALFDEIEAVIAEGGVNEFFNTAVQRLIERGLQVGFTVTGGLPWAEIDDAADLQFARTFVFPQLAQHQVLLRKDSVPALA